MLTDIEIAQSTKMKPISDIALSIGMPLEFEMTVNEVRLSAGAGFVVMICGKMMTMPGLPKTPAANNINVDDNGQITGLF